MKDTDGDSAKARAITLLANKQIEMLKSVNRYRFVQCIVEGSMSLCKRNKADWLIELKDRGFTPFPNEGAIGKGVSSSTDYDYLMSMPFRVLLAEGIQELLNQRDNLVQEVEKLKQTIEITIWEKDDTNVLEPLPKDPLKNAKKMITAAVEHCGSNREIYPRIENTFN